MYVKYEEAGNPDVCERLSTFESDMALEEKE